MSAEENKAIVRRLYDEVWNAGNVEVIDEVLSRDFTDHNPNPGIPPTSDGFRQTVQVYRSAFPDVHFTVDLMTSDGDIVVTRWTAEGTHKADLGEMRATGKHARVTGIDINRIVDGKATEHWGSWDQMALLQQLGAIPTDGQTQQVGA